MSKFDEPNGVGTAATDRILRALEGIDYGSVEIVIHGSRVVQIERKEKLRLDVTPPARLK